MWTVGNSAFGYNKTELVGLLIIKFKKFIGESESKFF